MKWSVSTLLIVGLLLAIITGCSEKRQVEKKEYANVEETLKGDDEMLILVRGEQGESVIFELDKSTATKSLYEQLPMSIDVEDYSTNEKIFYPEKKLDVSDTALAKGPIGTLAYYEPWGNVVMYYGDCGGASGLFALGQAKTGKDVISKLSGTIEIMKYDSNQE